MHGEMTQEDRVNYLQAFLEGEYSIIVSTPILGRGLDLLNVTQVRLVKLLSLSFSF